MTRRALLALAAALLAVGGCTDATPSPQLLTCQRDLAEANRQLDGPRICLSTYPDPIAIEQRDDGWCMCARNGITVSNAVTCSAAHRSDDVRCDALWRRATPTVQP